MIKTLSAAVLAGSVLTVALATGCTAHTVHTQAPTVQPPVAQATLNDAPLGGTLRVWHDATDFMDVTVSNVRFVDGLQVERADVVVKSTQGNNTVGYFSGINAAGYKQDEMSVNPLSLENYEFPRSELSEGGTMVQGEVRKGTVDIPALALTKIFLDSMDGPLATWNVP